MSAPGLAPANARAFILAKICPPEAPEPSAAARYGNGAEA